MKTKVLFPNPNHPNNNNNNNSAKQNPKPSKEKWIKAAIIAGIVFLGGILLAGMFFLSVLWGAFGELPSEAELTDIKNPLASEVYAVDGKLLGKYYIENRSYVPYNLISKNIINALVATEDARYFKHKGFDTKSYLRVLFKTILMGNSSSGGGSTISQQLIKNLYGRENHWNTVYSCQQNKRGNHCRSTRKAILKTGCLVIVPQYSFVWRAGFWDWHSYRALFQYDS